MTEQKIASRTFAAMSIVLALYAVVHGVLFAISGEPVYLWISEAGAIGAAVTACMRRKRNPRAETGRWIPSPTALGPGESFTFEVGPDSGEL